MRKSFAAAVIAASAAATSACGIARSESAGPTVSRNYQVGGFDQIEVAGPYDVEVRTGGNPSVAASGSEKLLGRTIVEVKGNKLLIHPEERHSWFHTGWSSRGKVKFVVTVPLLKGAEIAGSGGVKAGAGNVKSAEYEIAGSGGIDAGSVTAEQAKVSIAGSGSIRAHATRTADVEIMGSGDVNISGGAKCAVSKEGSGNVRCS